ncbi:hypothetical protein [Neobacillus niacini]|uniref:hypothetical protein n=1 Tax=Neobacillus niacini TaxID=86668 RepID=UPI0021CB42D8|nr:hypothetical protein [Neobacillus niacini]MCM3767005.1 hypothetical protein [Neobacillus niacini]
MDTKGNMNRKVKRVIYSLIVIAILTVLTQCQSVNMRGVDDIPNPKNHLAMEYETLNY